MKSIVAAAWIAIAANACKEAESALPPGEAGSSPATPAASPQAAPAVAEAQGVKAALSAYESIRAALAKDQLEGISEAATQLTRGARSAAAEVPEPARAQLLAMAQASEQLGGKVSGEDAALRRGFGELSRPVVELISKHPELQRGRHLFECPMAQGYKYWVQTSADTSNPYMGTKMATCGSQVKWGAAPPGG